MELRVSSPTHEDFVLVPVLPEEYPGEALPGSEMYYAEGPFGNVLLQQVSAEPFNILYNYYRIREKCLLRFTGDALPLRILVALKGKGHFTTGAGDTCLEQGQFNILYTPQINTTAVFEQAGELLMFNVYLPVHILEELGSIFPLQDFIDSTRDEQPGQLFQTPGWINAEILREIGYLLNFQQPAELRGYLFTLKIKQLLHLLLMQKNYKSHSSVNDALLNNILRARHIIESSLGEILTIEKIAGMAGITEYDLEKNFKHVVGSTLPAFITQARLNNAKLLIQETDLSIKQIAQISGYDHEQNFVKEFKKHFDYTPFFVSSPS